MCQLPRCSCRIHRHSSVKQTRQQPHSRQHWQLRQTLRPRLVLRKSNGGGADQRGDVVQHQQSMAALVPHSLGHRHGCAAGGITVPQASSRLAGDHSRPLRCPVLPAQRCLGPASASPSCLHQPHRVSSQSQVRGGTGPGHVCAARADECSRPRHACWLGSWPQLCRPCWGSLH